MQRQKISFFFTSFFTLFTTLFFLFSCASSNVSRDAASNVDMGVQNAKNLVDEGGDNAVTDSYQNTSQRTKGAILGGVAGGVTGSLTSGVGLFPGFATGAILGASYGSYIDSQTSLQDRLENRGVNIVILGDQILIEIPSVRIFNYMTATIKPQAYSTLQLVSNFINQYTKMMVKVAAYTSESGSPRADLALSQQQAESVAKFLLATGIDARLLYAAGYGGTQLVMRNSSEWAESDNFRIEITLEKLYV